MVEIIITVVLEVVKCLVPPTERQFSYVLNYTNNIENLKTEVEKLKDDRASVQHEVDEAKQQGEEIENKVENWLARVNKIITEAEKFIDDEDNANKRCLKGLCPNLKTRHRHSKDAVKQLEAISKLRETVRFDKISYRSIPEDIVLMSGKDYEVFESRMYTLNNILGALKDPNVNMLGIYGMGGIGKTMVAKEVAKQVLSDKLFDQVVFVEVSPSQDIRKIQGDIADKLGLTLHEENELGRARSLYNQLKKERNILLILDNIWENLDLHAVGIPHRDYHKRCKILLTARSEETLSSKMDSQKNFLVGGLDEEEAWRLFKKMAGDYIEGSEFKSVAMNVVKKCAGLPVSIVTLARALRNKRLFEWKDALEQLRRPSSTNFKNIQSTTYSALELSFNKLEGEELKKVFLLIGYTYIESTRDLLMYGMGLGLFQGIYSMEEARVRVLTLVQKLKASCMLLDHIVKDEEWFSMHDVVRDVAIAIASTKYNVLTVTNGEPFNQWKLLDENTVKLYTSMVLCNVKADVLPEVLEGPQLEFLLLRGEGHLPITIPNSFFTRMKQNRVLALRNIDLPSLPSSLGLLTNARTLCLNYCNLQDIATLGALKKLEILCLQDSRITHLPEEIGELTRLRFFDLGDCWNLQVIPANVLSKLTHLEELYIYNFINWEVEVEGLKNASLDELKQLANLTSLEFQTKYVNILVKGLFFQMLERYKITLGEVKLIMPKWYGTSRIFELRLNTNISLKDGLIVPLKKVEDLSLSELQEHDIKNFVSEMANVGFLPLKRLKIVGCVASNPRESNGGEESTTDIQSNEMISENESLFDQKVVLPNLEALHLQLIYVERIWQSQLTTMSCGIQNLTSLAVYDCRNLRCIFSSSIISGFSRLQKLEIKRCPGLEEMVVVDQAERKNIIFPQLRLLNMKKLQKLTNFCSGDVHVEFPSLKELRISQCPEFMVKYKNSYQYLTIKVSVFPNLEILRVKATNMPWIYCGIDGLELDENVTKATKRNVNKFGDTENICKPAAILDNLEKLEIQDMECDNVINLVPSSTTFQNLTVLEVLQCNGFKKLLTFSTAKSLVRLSEMVIDGCDTVVEIVADDKEDNSAKDEIVFNELKELTFIDLYNLTSFCSGNCMFKFPALENLLLHNCPKMKIFSGGELRTPMLQNVQWNMGNEECLSWEGDLESTIQQLYQKKYQEL